MLLSKAFPVGTEFVPFTSSEDLTSNYILLGIACAAIPGNLLFLFFGMSNEIAPSALFLYCRCLGGLLVLISNLIIFASNIANGGFALGAVGCKISVFFNMFGACFFLLMLTFVAMERHLTICHGFVFTRRKVLWLITVGFLVSITYAMFLLFWPRGDEAILLSDSSFICIPAWHSTSFPNSELNYAPLVGLALCLCYIIIAYALVYFQFKTSFEMRRNKIFNANSINEREFDDVKEKEMLIFKICIFNTIPFIISWIPLQTQIIYEFTSKNAIKFPYSMLVSACLLLEPMLNPYVQIMFDNRVKGMIKETSLYKLAKSVSESFHTKSKQSASLEWQISFPNHSVSSPQLQPSKMGTLSGSSSMPKCEDNSKFFSSLDVKNVSSN